MRLAALAAACAALTLVAASAAEIPARKPGYWETTMQTDPNVKMPKMVLHVCIDAASDKAMMVSGGALVASMCKSAEPQKSGDSYVWDSECQVGKMTTKSHMTVSGDFQSAYSLSLTGEMTGSSSGLKSMAMTEAFKWLADTCPNGMKPGDIETPAGIVNMLGK
jgi:hypothetical protein